MTRDELWIKAMSLGAAAGCHQMPERSFFIGGYQMPVCARCTGVFLGQCAAFAVLICRKRVPAWAAAVLLLTMGADWFVQYIGLRESTNPRRLVTGVLGGMGVVFLWAAAVRAVINEIKKK